MEVGLGVLIPFEKAREVALQPISKDQISQIEDDLLDVINSLKKMRQEWASSGEKTADLEIEKAQRFVEYLKGTWANRLYSQFKQSQARKSAQATRERFSKKED